MAEPFINLIEAVDRKVRVTSNGIEIVTTLYVEPATAAPIVVCALLGSVDSKATPPTRRLPAHDHEYPFCYCASASVTPIDRRSVSSSPSMLGGSFDVPTTFDNVIAALKKKIIFDGPTIFDPKENKKAMCGSHIEAIYRPLPTIYDEEDKPAKDWEHPSYAFDYIDPQFFPASRTFPANGMPGRKNSFCLLGSLGSPVEAPDSGDTSLLVTETWQEITIRRVMCPTVPWDTIRKLQNRINENAWTPANMKLAGLPNNTFPKGTLRFDSAEVIKRTMPTHLDAAGAQVFVDDIPATADIIWWDILYKFSWRTTWDKWSKYGTFFWQGPEYIPWNCDWYIGTSGWLNTLYPGWYDMVFEKQSGIVGLFIAQTRRKYLSAEDTELNLVVPAGKHPFDLLFLLDSK